MNARCALAALIAVVTGLAAPVPATATLPIGIVRPDDESHTAPRALGAELFAGNCATCHGIAGAGQAKPAARRGTGGVRGQGPPLRGVGALAADFYLRTGYMPLARPGDQPTRSRVLLSGPEIRALVDYVASLQAGPPIPRPAVARGSLSDGMHLFTEHCAGCHQVAARGGIVTGARVPPLQDATASQIAEAVRIGPYVMPRFSSRQISDRQLDSIVRYVLASRHPVDRGGWAIGNLGPVPEGMVAWLVATTVLIGVCMLLGRRLRR